MKKIAILILVSLLFGACANNQAISERIAQMEQKVAQNKGELDQLRKEVQSSSEANKKSYNQKTESLELAVKKLQDEQLTLSDARQQKALEQKEDTKPMAKETQAQATSETLELIRKMNQMEAELREVKTALAEKSKVVPSSGTSGASFGSAVRIPTPAVEEYTDPVRRAYEEARAEYNNGHHQKAISKFDAFVKSHPESEYAGNAHYWKGESYYAMSDWRQALKEFQMVTTEYANSWKEADAQLKVGMCYLNLGEPDKARAALNILKRDFPQYGRMDLVNHYLNQID